ncbi:hypothetical protein [Asticcacaulis taihuensis]|uniref:hypothetical protein n=1 Tax=Asticcacaulis taihuensis TaxID=260084 RepID=UPI0026F296AF|nr:hypothetical protein [Asticcacaulis taihuensis]
MNEVPRRDRGPPDWVAHYLGKLAKAGKYSRYWLPEVLSFYEAVLHEEGQKSANEWLKGDLHVTFSSDMALKIYLLIRLYLAVERVYRKVMRS